MNANEPLAASGSFYRENRPMVTPSLIRTVAAGSIAAGIAVLCWFNRLPKQEQDDAERTARGYGSRLIDKTRERLGIDDPPGPMSLPR